MARMRPTLLFLTNPNNGDSEEDFWLIRHLSKHFRMIVRHPLKCSTLLHSVDGVIIRNIWPTHEYLTEWEELKTHLREANIRTYNPLTYQGDIEGKDYLVVLSEAGFPVIPSVDRVDEIFKLPTTEEFWIKPKHSCDGFGSRKITRTELLSQKLENYIIQPFLEFESEPSFFFVDNRFHHAISAKHRIFDDKVTTYTASEDDLVFAKQFVEWSAMPFGVQRIDAIRLENGCLLLTEIENLCPYLYLMDIDATLRLSFANKLSESLLTLFSSIQAVS